ncbi:hypothetical protein H1R20_g3689, partial [Candolleomyces eurysporus]
MVKSTKRPNHRNVPCECAQCGGIKHVTQEERRRHLKQEKARLDKALRRVLQQDEHEWPVVPQSLSSQGTVPSNPIAPPISPTTPSEPTAMPLTAPAEFPDAMMLLPDDGPPVVSEPILQLSAQSGMFGSTMPTAEEEVFKPVIDDDWEEPEPAEDACDDQEGSLLASISPPAPSGPVPAIAVSPSAFPTTNSSQPPSPPVAQGVPAFKTQENSPDPFITPVNIPLSIPGVEEEMDRWRSVARYPGCYTDIFDGAVPRQSQAPDGSLFFQNNAEDSNGPNGELRIGFKTRTDYEHRIHGKSYANLTTPKERDDFVKLNATRWSEFARLPYFDIVRCIIIDPMHNLLLGLVKTHFYHIWVQGKILCPSKELRMLHGILADMPSYLGRLPSLVGIPAGGSLTADQWMLMATVIAPIAIPKIWHVYMSDPATARIQRAAAIQAWLDKKAKAAKARKQKQKQKQKNSTNVAPTPRASTTATSTPETPMSAAPTSKTGKRKHAARLSNSGDNELNALEDDEELAACLHPDDPSNFMKLCRALRLLLARQISDQEIDEAEKLLSEYCSELVTLYGKDVICPNHHYAVHTPDCLRDFGPLHGFWTFLFERLNKVLKSYKTNNQGGGELEATFFHFAGFKARHVRAVR